MKVFQEARRIVDALTPKYGEREAKAMMRIIFENLKGWNPVDVAVKANEEVSDFIAGKIDSVVGRLLADEPIQYIFGNADFYGLNFKVTEDTLIPRPETAELVDIIVGENQRKDLHVLDACTGSGCIAIALARNLPFADVVATDISDKALAVARENNKRLKTSVQFLKADILKGEPAGEAFDIIVSNPPYICEKEKSGMPQNVLRHEPSLALFVPDEDPLRFYRGILSLAKDYLAPGGKIYFEINPLYARVLLDLAHRDGFGDVEIVRDSFGKLRFAKISR